MTRSDAHGLIAKMTDNQVHDRKNAKLNLLTRNFIDSAKSDLFDKRLQARQVKWYQFRKLWRIVKKVIEFIDDVLALYKD